MITSRGYRNRGLAKTVDWWLVGCWMLLVLIGWVNIYASIHSTEPSSIFSWSCRSGKQFVWILTSVGLAATLLFLIPARAYEGLSFPIYLFVLALLGAVIFLGTEVKGSRSWFNFGPVSFQPAEISKISTSLMLATVMSQLGYSIRKFKSFVITALIILVPMMTIVLQSETGSALVYVGFIFMLYREGLSGWLIFMVGMAIVLFIMTISMSPYSAILVLCGVTFFCILLYSGKLKWWFIICLPVLLLLGFTPYLLSLSPALQKINPIYVIIGAICITIPIVAFRAFREGNRFAHLGLVSLIAGLLLIFSADFFFNNVLQDHQRNRIEELLGMKEDPKGVGYNQEQSKIAIGSGGVFGKGYLNGTQTTNGFVPEQSTDFIFCTIGEEWGFVGSAFVLLLYVFLIWRIIHDAERSREAFTRIYGYCVACCIFMHLFINIGMTLGIMPVIGIPLPFISYGGSSMWAFTILLFIFIALNRNERKYF